MMTPRQKRRVYLGLALACFVLFAAGVAIGFHGRHTPICTDGKPPTKEQELSLGQVRYLCHDGKIVTK